MSNAMTGSPAPVPADLSCGKRPPVWVNTRTHKFHWPKDPMYGMTKEGKYMCLSAAKGEGDTPAGGGHMRHKGDGSNDSGM